MDPRGGRVVGEPDVLGQLPGLCACGSIAQAKVGQRLAWPDGAQPKWMPPLYGDPLRIRRAGLFLWPNGLYRYERNEMGVWDRASRWSATWTLSREEGDTLVALGGGARVAGLSICRPTDAGGVWLSTDGGATMTPARHHDCDPGRELFVRARCIVGRSGPRPRRLWVAGSAAIADPPYWSPKMGGARFTPLGDGIAPDPGARPRSRVRMAACMPPPMLGPYVVRPPHGSLGFPGRRDLPQHRLPQRGSRSRGGRILRFGTFGRGVWDYHLP